MTPTFSRTAVLVPVAVPRAWSAAEPVTSPILVVEPPTNPIPVVGDRPGTGSVPAEQHARHASVLAGLVILVGLLALLVALGVI